MPGCPCATCSAVARSWQAAAVSSDASSTLRSTRPYRRMPAASDADATSGDSEMNVSSTLTLAAGATSAMSVILFGPSDHGSPAEPISALTPPTSNRVTLRTCCGRSNTRWTPSPVASNAITAPGTPAPTTMVRGAPARRQRLALPARRDVGCVEQDRQPAHLAGVVQMHVGPGVRPRERRRAAHRVAHHVRGRGHAPDHAPDRIVLVAAVGAVRPAGGGQHGPDHVAGGLVRG